jgi:uncharacterized protein (DUF1330 family)
MKMSDAYLFVSYKQAADPSRLAAYGALAVRAIEQFGGTVIARAEPSHIYEAGQSELTVLVRFNSVDEATALYDSAIYREALAALGSGASRDVRIIPAL